MIIEIVILLILALPLAFYLYMTKNFGYWERLGFPCISGSFPYGSHKELILKTRHFNEVTREDYEKFKDKDFYGTYLLGKPFLHINNVDIARDILVKNFDHFVDRNTGTMNNMVDGGDMDQMWNKQLSRLSGDAWKDVRSTFSPIFTSGKMRGMYKFMKEIGNRLTDDLGDKADAGVDFELKEVFGKFSLDTIATCAFGIDPNSFKDKETTFVKAAARIFQNTFLDSMKSISRLIPGVAALHRLLNISIIKPKETRFLTNIIRQTIQNRRENGHRENDLIDLMIDCIKTEGKTADDMLADNENESNHQDQYDKDMHLMHISKNKHFDEDTIVATSLVMLVAGYDTTGITLSFLSYDLAQNLDIQETLQAEIDQAFDENDGQLPDYTTIQALPYLDNCIHETLRLHSPAGFMLRSCNTDYKLPGTNYTVKKNDLISIPAVGIHNDERYYPNPSQFNPDNFSKEARQSRSPYTFLGFGQGPRACIGMRFALLEAKVAVAMMMRKYTFLPSTKNPAELKIDPNGALGWIEGGLWSKISTR